MNDFLTQAFVFLFAAVVCVLISKKLGMGSVLGYLFAGVLIGPFALGFVGQDGADIMHATEFGVVMMLFLVGLELDPKEFWKIRNEIIGLGTAQAAGTTIIVAAIARWGLGLSIGTAITMGFVITMSSTAIILQTISERGLNKSNAGKSSFAVLLFQDIMVIPVMAIIPLLAVSTKEPIATAAGGSWLDGAPVFMKTLAILGAISTIFLVGNYIVNPLFRSVGRLQIREIYTASALLLVIGVSLLMQQVGLSPALGAFIAGVVLANNPYKHQLESDIEPFKALLLGIFFIAVGSTINFDIIVNQPLIILSLLVGSMAIKAIVLLAISKWKKFPKDQSFLFAILLSQVGEFAFVILALGKTINLINQQWYDYLLATTALSMVVTPILLLLNEKWISPYLGLTPSATEQQEYDDLSHISAEKKIVIAGFGDFGNTIGRLLQANDIPTLVLDNDSERVNHLRKLGFNVYYGDATSINILKSIGVDQADYVIAAMDPPEVNQHLVAILRKNFPNVEVIVRAKNRKNAYEYLQDGLTEVYRETFFTAVYVGATMLEKVGLSHEEARTQSELFIKSDRASLRKLAKNIHNLEDYINVSRMEFAEQSSMLKDSLKHKRNPSTDEFRQE
ncbi:monovalent cation:proton antiporter-2 (CPA2) family protein [Myroides phaeus]|uniref:Monovalent cation:H+ antiporter-2, CPA2 family n=1 Tax=Myroides phaeus TaxID=702745 RepID=A0A1G8G0N0_9FLAO|nr:monovalent cation:proton antiporter-2 (CPA2) family protein [Myroides phaeus]MEC4116501.1 monovalent cation:proton antiporter-2 (CPA2) family protein [Myroides phaeus]SDH87921.1 monovalent cation:H+ antiporter-2, CPA2 family [Myroides phaeus]